MSRGHFIEAFVISLARAPQRAERLVPRIAGHLRVHVVEAVDGIALALEDLRRLAGDGYAPRIMRHLRPNEIACSASHFKAWRAFLESQATHALILEDDCQMLPGGLETLQHLVAELPNLDILRIAGNEPLTARGVVHGTIGETSVLRVETFGFGSYGYVVSRRGAERLARHALRIRETVDDYLRQVQRHGCDLFEAAPHLAVHDDNGHSTIGDVSGPHTLRLSHHVRTAWYRTSVNSSRSVINALRFWPDRLRGASLVRFATR